MERAAGIEPALSAWKAEALPLCNARIMYFYFFHTINGAGEGSRTPTPKALDPKSSASANFATSAFFWWLTGESNPGHLD